VILDFIFAAIAVSAVMIVLLPALVIVAPLALLGRFLALRSTSEDAPALPDPESFDRPADRTELKQLVERLLRFAERKEGIQREAKHLEIGMTNSGRYDQRKKAGKLFNQEIDELNYAMQMLYGEIWQKKQCVYSTLPNYRSDFDAWLRKRATFLATKAAGKWYVYGAVVGFVLIRLFGDLFASESFLGWPASASSAAGVGALAAVGAFLRIRRSNQATLGAAIDKKKVHGWLELYRYWDPDDNSQLTAGIEGDSSHEHEALADDTAVRPWHEILGVQPNASVEEIKSAWKTRLKEYHPDHVAALGPKLKELAEEETKTLNAAYETAMQLKQGF
jgi:hypothetical protein